MQTIRILVRPCHRLLGFRWPRYHDSDHRAVVTTIKSGRRRLKEYWRKRQEFPLQLPPVEQQQDDLTRAFEALKVTCEEPEAAKAHWRYWINNNTWLLIKQRTSLRRVGQLRQSEGRRMQRAIHAALKRDRAATGGATRLASPSSLNMQRCMPKLGMTPPMRRRYEPRWQS